MGIEVLPDQGDDRVYFLRDGCETFSIDKVELETRLAAAEDARAREVREVVETLLAAGVTSVSTDALQSAFTEVLVVGNNPKA